MSTALVLYVLLGSFAVALCVWAVLSAAAPVAEHRGWHRFWTLSAGALLPPAVGTLLLVREPGTGYVLACLPPLALACAWSNAITLRRQSALLRLLHLPVQVWNVLLCGVYALLAAHELYGFDLGTGPATLVAAFVQMQSQIGHPQALHEPRWLYLPFVLPLWLAYRAHHALALTLAGIVATGLLALVAQGLPAVHLRVGSFRGPKPATVVVLPEHCSLGVVVAPAEGTRPQEHCAELGATIFAVRVSPELLADPRRAAAAKDELARARERGMTTVVLMEPPERCALLPARDLDELCTAMGKAQWLAAEQLAPSRLVLFCGPFSRLAACLETPATLDDWCRKIARAAEDARQANAKIRTAVAIEGTAPHSRELFERLLRSDGPVDDVLLLESPGDAPLAESERRMAMHADWLKRTVGMRPVWALVECGVPSLLGGDAAQARFVRSAVRFAAGNPRLEALVIDALVDHAGGGGLWTREGRRRAAVLELRAAGAPSPATSR